MARKRVLPFTPYEALAFGKFSSRPYRDRANPIDDKHVDFGARIYGTISVQPDYEQPARVDAWQLVAIALDRLALGWTVEKLVKEAAAKEPDTQEIRDRAQAAHAAIYEPTTVRGAVRASLDYEKIKVAG